LRAAAHTCQASGATRPRHLSVAFLKEIKTKHFVFCLGITFAEAKVFPAKNFNIENTPRKLRFLRSVFVFLLKILNRIPLHRTQTPGAAQGYRIT
jgi:hypothetical protein